MKVNPSIMFVTTEVFPFAKTGGLADVSAFLPKALRCEGYDIRIMMPKFRGIEDSFGEGIEKVASGHVELAGVTHEYSIEMIQYEGNIVYFVNAPYYFDRDRLYDYEDEMERFVYFSKAVLNALPLIGFKPNIIHCNDWLTGCIPLFLATEYRHLEFFRSIRTIFTIHALLYQGVFHNNNASKLLGLQWDELVEMGLDYYDQINCMKIGIMTADVISTVSPSYAKEISKMSPLNMEPLTESLFKRRREIVGILNGIDPNENDPSKDSRIYANYSATAMEGKAINKSKLQEALGLPVRADVPIVSLISRLEITKGLYLLEKSYHELLKEDIQFVVVGDGIPYYDYLFTNIMKAWPDKMHYSTYNPDLAYQVYAGSDLFLMPSYTEACGISQLIGMRYGTVPIIRETGGLTDTVKPYNKEDDTGNGFTFKYASQWVMLDTIRKAVDVFQDKEQWNRLVYRNMTSPVGWENSVREYRRLYEHTVGVEARLAVHAHS